MGAPTVLETFAAINAEARLRDAAPDLAEALENLLAEYVSLAHSGDCGAWDPEKDAEVITARAALSKARGETE